MTGKRFQCEQLNMRDRPKLCGSANFLLKVEVYRLVAVMLLRYAD